MPQVREYLQYLRAQRTDCMGKAAENVLQTVEKQYGTQDTHAINYEIRLDREDTDVSVLINPPDAPKGSFPKNNLDEDFTPLMSKDDALSFLRTRFWKGDLSLVERYLTEWERYSKDRQFLLDFEIHDGRISENVRKHCPIRILSGNWFCHNPHGISHPTCGNHSYADG